MKSIIEIPFGKIKEANIIAEIVRLKYTNEPFLRSLTHSFQMHSFFGETVVSKKSSVVSGINRMSARLEIKLETSSDLLRNNFISSV